MTLPPPDHPATAVPLRMAVIGARRVRQGTGEYVARELAARGCTIAGVVGTSPASVEAARAGLLERHGIDARGYTSLAALLEREAVDAVAVCSPHEAHLAPLEVAAAAGLHVFAEKPLYWRPGLERAPAEEVAATVERLVERLAAAGRTLHLNAQWPYTLERFFALHPEARGAPPASFEMWLSPMTAGADAVVDAGSHLISMLQALLGPGDMDDVEVTSEDAGGDRLEVACTYVHAAGATRAALRLGRCPAPPRPAGYALDGRAVERRIELPSYRFTFEAADGRAVPVPDPLVASVEDFLRSAAAGRRPDRTALVQGMTQLQALVAAASTTASRGVAS
ncbi:MAG: Gfo/Idh/MocA family oxidoreductase [Planctomycetes bacterium]|nr:Gfo/Idh/MocA family oxidoreductase [Planctomycetota bacterium]